jgi:hypothetical protein
MTLAFNPTPINWSQLNDIGANIGQGYQRRALAKEMQGAFGPNGELDYEKMMQILSARQPEMAAKMAMSQQDASNRYGHNLVFDENGNAYQTMSGGGLAPVQGEDGAKLTAPQTWQQGPSGVFPVPSRGPMGGPTPRPVPTMDVRQDGSMTPTQPQGDVPQQPGAIPSLESTKYQNERAATKATDKALAADAIAKFDEAIANMGSLVDESGKSTEQLRRITGNREVGGVDTGIPNAWLPNVSQTARDAAANKETAAVQIGLNTLAQMRAASAQGASGMGQLAIQESVWLQNSIRSLQETQGTPQAAKHIQDIVNNAKRVQARIRDKYKEVYNEDLGHVPGPMDNQSGGGKRTSTGVEWSIEP